MKIFIVGLGLMGSAYALKLSQKGHHVNGIDINENHVAFNAENNWINQAADTTLETADLVILAMPVEACLTFTKDHLSTLNQVPCVTDIAGIKQPLVDEMQVLLGDRYISHHPMTGKESAGPMGAIDVVFEHKNVIVIDHQATQKATDIFEKMLADLAVSSPVFMDAKSHDQAIAMTSHLPHVVAACLMHQPGLENVKKAAGNSFFETTRFAAMNTDLWSELFMANQGALISTLESFIDNLEAFKRRLNSKEDTRRYLRDAFNRYLDLKG